MKAARRRFRPCAAIALALAASACAPIRPPLPPPVQPVADDRAPTDAVAEVPSPAAPTPEPALTPGQRAAARAVSLVGVPYRFGGTSPTLGFDCSGLVQHAYRVADLSLPRDSREQRAASVRIEPAAREVGDLLFYRRGRGQSLHVALYVGNDLFVHAPSRGGTVRVESMATPHWKRRFIEVRRPLPGFDSPLLAAR